MIPSASDGCCLMCCVVQAKAKILKETLFKINQKHGQGTVMAMTGESLDM